MAEYRNDEIVCSDCKHRLDSHRGLCGVIGCSCRFFAWRKKDALAAAVVQEKQAAQKAALNAPPPRTIRVMTGFRDPRFGDVLYAVASDGTLWTTSVQPAGGFGWAELPSLPQGPSAFPPEST